MPRSCQDFGISALAPTAGKLARWVRGREYRVILREQSKPLLSAPVFSVLIERKEVCGRETGP
uniref:hypothetical protein n=1 Tax=Ferrovum myxofaciens TaxID=416213 RepID=UPI001F3F09CA